MQEWKGNDFFILQWEAPVTETKRAKSTENDRKDEEGQEVKKSPENFERGVEQRR